MKLTLQTLLLLVTLLFQTSSSACLWDSDTLADEKKARAEMAEAILGNPPDLGDPVKLRKRIADLQGNRREDDPAWWNDLAGAHIRLGESKIAAELLESVVTRFPDDYGVHANLGTAYHLLGRYAEAEKHIARNLEINPDAHFGLEKYHLALLQYLSKDEKYKREHVYVDEYSIPFLYEEWSNLSLMSTYSVERQAPPDASTPTNGFPAYRLKWNLAGNTNRENGVVYMASLNPREPACFVMLGIECLARDRDRDLNLAIAAFKRAIELGSPQTEILQRRISIIEEHINFSRNQRNAPMNLAILLFATPVVLWLGWRLVRWMIRNWKRAYAT